MGKRRGNKKVGRMWSIQNTSLMGAFRIFRYTQQTLSLRSPITSTSKNRWGIERRNEALKERRIEWMIESPNRNRFLPVSELISYHHSELRAFCDDGDLERTLNNWCLNFPYHRSSKRPQDEHTCDGKCVRMTSSRSEKWWREQELWTTFFSAHQCTSVSSSSPPKPKTIPWLLFGVSGWFKTGRLHNESEQLRIEEEVERDEATLPFFLPRGPPKLFFRLSVKAERKTNNCLVLA